MRVEVHLVSQSKPILHEDAVNTYIKNGMYCLLLINRKVYKYPMVNIFRVVEDI